MMIQLGIPLALIVAMFGFVAWATSRNWQFHSILGVTALIFPRLFGHGGPDAVTKPTPQHLVPGRHVRILVAHSRKYLHLAKILHVRHIVQQETQCVVQWASRQTTSAADLSKNT